jgi:hypothetical protein
MGGLFGSEGGPERVKQLMALYQRFAENSAKRRRDQPARRVDDGGLLP